MKQLDVYKLFAEYLKYTCSRSVGNVVTLSSKHFAKYVKDVYGIELSISELTKVGNILSTLELVNVVSRVSNRNYIAYKSILTSLVNTLTIEELSEWLRNIVENSRNDTTILVVTKLHFEVLKELCREPADINTLSKKIKISKRRLLNVIEKLSRFNIVTNIGSRITLTKCGARIAGIVLRKGSGISINVREVCKN